MSAAGEKKPRTDADIVKQVVGTYLRRSHYARVIVDDLEQEAHTALAKARQTFSADVGEWAGYAYRVAWLALASFLVAESSPVTRREKGAPNTARRAPEDVLTGTGRYSFDGAYSMESGIAPPNPPFRQLNPFGVTTETAEDLVSTMEWDAVVRARVLVVCRGDLDIVRILMEETTPAEVAARRGIPVSRIYNSVAGARARLSDDLELYSLMTTKNGVQSEDSGGERE